MTAVDLSKGVVLLDRDGVINKDRGTYVSKPSELIVLSNALRAIARLTAAGIRIGICTNQGGIARGIYDEAILAEIHAKMMAAVHDFGGEIEHIVFCPSYDNADPRRKPNPGMLLEQAAFFGLADLAGVPFVGDNVVDVQAARAAGAVPVLVKTGKGRQVAAHHREQLQEVKIYPNLEEAAADWLRRKGV